MPDRPGVSERGRSSIGPRGRRGNLPAQLTSLVGRRQELTDVGYLVRTSRLVTLTGVGGVGKTRLALRVASDLRRTFDHGVWFVDLAEARALGATIRRVREVEAEAAEAAEAAAVAPDLDVLAYLVMSALEVRLNGVGPPAAELVRYLADLQTLLVLDNCEHLLPECARLMDELLRSSEQLRVLATSREPLAVPGEVQYAVPPLPQPDPDRSRLDELARCESVALFVERARAAVPDFSLTEQNGDSVARLCRGLDGLPLAIELAAARVRVLAPQQMLARLTDRFALLSRSGRDVPARQQTLRACVEWSFELCTVPERLLWSRLSVFVGGFELDAVERVCAGDVLPAEVMVEVLAGLVDKSIVGRVDRGHDGGQARYRMLETLRGFGRERLIEAGEETVLRRRHRDWCQDLLHQVAEHRLGDQQTSWLGRLTHERANLRAAIEFCLNDPADVETAMHLLVTLPRQFWANSGAAREGLHWLNRALNQTTAPTLTRANALAVAAALASLAGDAATLAQRLEQARRLATRLDDPFALAYCEYVETATAWRRNDLTRALESAESGLSFLSRMTEPDPMMRLHLLIHALWAAAMAGDQHRSRQFFDRIQEACDSREDAGSRSMAQWGMAIAAWRAGHVIDAEEHVRESVRIRQLRAVPYLHHAALNVELMAWIAAQQQQYRRAATLLGAADSLLADHGTPISTAFHMLRQDHHACEHSSREALGDDAFTTAFRHGQTLTPDEALAHAVEEPPAPQPAPAKSSATAHDATTPLTRREQQVAELVGRGLSNKDIARTLVISRRTAEGHVEHILSKLGFTSRAQIATWIANQHGHDGHAR